MKLYFIGHRHFSTPMADEYWFIDHIKNLSRSVSVSMVRGQELASTKPRLVGPSTKFLPQKVL